MDFNEILFTLLMVSIILFTLGWIVKKYFSINNEQLKKGSSKYYVDSNNLSAANHSTITESNNALSKLPFDGVNRNPEYEESCALTHKIKNIKRNSKIKHKSFINQAHI